jgi:hypothetical protein
MNLVEEWDFQMNCPKLWRYIYRVDHGDLCVGMTEQGDVVMVEAPTPAPGSGGHSNRDPMMAALFGTLVLGLIMLLLLVVVVVGA